jgi:DNA-binding HxlR family transcriptional regulator
MALGKGYAGQECTLARTLELVGERWTMLVLRDAFYGVRRYNDFLSHLDVPRAVLAERLQTLVEAGVLEKRIYQETPRRDEYVLTEAGRGLWSALYALAQWGEQHLAPSGPWRLFFHAECEARLDASGVCPRCGRRVAPEEVEVRPGAPSAREDPVSIALRRPHRLLEPLFGERAAASDV